MANLRRTAFGCGGVIHFPIPPEAEEWLLSRLPEDLGGLVGKLLLKAIADFKWDGTHIDAARSRNDLYSLKKPVERKWGGFLSKKTVNSSQLLEMLLGVGSMQPSHAVVRTLACEWSFGSCPNTEFRPPHLPGKSPGKSRG
jgi:hypothetical protein